MVLELAALEQRALVKGTSAETTLRGLPHRTDGFRLRTPTEHADVSDQRSSSDQGFVHWVWSFREMG